MNSIEKFFFQTYVKEQMQQEIKIWSGTKNKKKLTSVNFNLDFSYDLILTINWLQIHINKNYNSHQRLFL